MANPFDNYSPPDSSGQQAAAPAANPFADYKLPASTPAANPFADYKPAASAPLQSHGAGGSWDLNPEGQVREAIRTGSYNQLPNNVKQQYFQMLGNQNLAEETAKAQQAALQPREQYVAQHPIAGNIANVANAVTQGVQRSIGQGISLFNPTTGNAIQQGLQTVNPVVPGKMATVGEAVGGMEIPLATAMVNPAAGAAMLGAQAAGQSREDIAQQRAEGATISGGKEAGQALLQGGVNAGAGLLFGKVGKYVGDLVGNLAPDAAKAVAAGDASALQKVISKTLQLTGKSASGAAVNELANTASNAIKKGVDPTTAITQGWLPAGVMGAGLTHAFPEPAARESEGSLQDYLNRGTPPPAKAPAGEPPVSKAAAPSIEGRQQELFPEPAHTQPALPFEQAAAEKAAKIEANKAAGQKLYETLRGGPEAVKKFQDQQEQVAQVNKELGKAPTANADEEKPPMTQDTTQAPKVAPGVSHEDLGLNPELTGPAHEAAQSRALEQLGRPPNFTENMASEGTAPGEIGTRNHLPEPVGEKGTEGEQNELFPESPKGTESKQGELQFPEPAKPQEAKPPVTPAKAPTWVDRFKTWLNMGRASEGIRSMSGLTDNDIRRVTSSVEPFRKAWTKAANGGMKMGDWIDHYEKTGQSLIPELQPMADFLTKENQSDLAARKARGEDVSQLKKFHVHYMASDFPTDKGFNGGMGGLAGKEGFNKSRESENWADFERRVGAAGGKIKHQNLPDLIMAGLADKATSRNARDLIANKWVDEGLSRQIDANEHPPEGWSRLPDRLATDTRLNTIGGKQIIVPTDVAQGLDNYWKNRDASTEDLDGAIKSFNKTAQGMKFLGDMVTLSRNVAGGISHILSGAVRGQNSMEWNPVNAQRIGYKLMNESITDLEANPATKPLADNLRQMQEAGLKTDAFKTLPGQEPGLAKRALTAAQTVTLHQKIGEAVLAAKYTNEQIESGAWTKAEGAAFNRRYVKIMDDLFGHSNEPQTGGPKMTTLRDIASPLWRYLTAAPRAIARNVYDVAGGTPLMQTTVPETVMAVMATMGMTNAVAAGIRKYRTGSASMPLTWKNILVPPIGKNPDTGEDESLNMSGFSLPLTKTLVNIAQGNYGQAIKDYFNPLLTSAAESVVGRTTHGQDISSTADRLTHLAKSVMPINVQNLINHEGNFNLASTMGETVGIRPAPGIISRSESENTLYDAAQKNTMGYPAATKDAWARWNQMAATPAKYDQSYDKIMDEMQSNPNINPEQIKLADKRWQRQPGVERDILNDQVGPDDILQAWHEAGDDEKAAMKDAIQERLAHVDYRKISDAQQDAWDAVDKATR